MASNPGGYLTTYAGSSTASIDAKCAAACILRAGANYFRRREQRNDAGGLLLWESGIDGAERSAD
jgi:hypothetical protein